MHQGNSVFIVGGMAAHSFGVFLSGFRNVDVDGSPYLFLGIFYYLIFLYFSPARRKQGVSFKEEICFTVLGTSIHSFALLLLGIIGLINIGDSLVQLFLVIFCGVISFLLRPRKTNKNHMPKKA